MSRRVRGFSLIEALISAVLCGIAVAALVGALGGMQRTEARLIEAERLENAARDKYDEIIATADYTTLDGNFEDRGLPYSWTATVETTGVENLESLRVTVTHTVGERTAERSVEGLVYRPPQNTGGTTP